MENIEMVGSKVSMNLGSLFFAKYKNFNKIFKILLGWFLLIALALWLIGNLTKVDCLLMYLIGAICGLILFYIFQVEINKFLNTVTIYFEKYLNFI